MPDNVRVVITRLVDHHGKLKQMINTWRANGLVVGPEVVGKRKQYHGIFGDYQYKDVVLPTIRLNPTHLKQTEFLNKT